MKREKPLSRHFYYANRTRWAHLSATFGIMVFIVQAGACCSQFEEGLEEVPEAEITVPPPSPTPSRDGGRLVEVYPISGKIYNEFSNRIEWQWPDRMVRVDAFWHEYAREPTLEYSVRLDEKTLWINGKTRVVIGPLSSAESLDDVTTVYTSNSVGQLCESVEALQETKARDLFLQIGIATGGVAKELECIPSPERIRGISFRNSGESFVTEATEYLHRFEKLRWLDLENTLADDRALANVAKLEGLIELCVGDSSVTDVGISSLSGSSSLVHFRARRKQISEKSLAVLGSITSLRTLDLIAPIEDEWLVHLSKSQKLRELRVPYSEITDAGLVHLAGLQDLEVLDLHRTKVGDEGLKIVGKLKSLKVLDISNHTVTDVGIEHIAKLDGLLELDIGHARRVTDTGISSLAKLDKLVVLDLSSVRVTDAGLSRLVGLSELRKLVLGFTPITDRGMTSIGQLEGLRILDIRETAVTGRGLAKLSRLQRLRELNISMTNVGDEGVQSLVSMKSLRFMDVTRAKFSTAGIRELKQRRPDILLLGAKELEDGFNNVSR